MPVFQDVRQPFIPVAINHNLFTLLIMLHNIISTPSTSHTCRISNDAIMEFGVHFVDNHIRKMDLTVVYTNNPVMLEDSINTMERLLAEEDKYKVVGFDLAYTSGRVGHDHKVTVT
ncbi:hypothetical protein D1007_15228 [Hordeum vulgare]|nr:hypothetical protein D1007_15228 [Hordeum vulgare]